jgi:hypothetical protein
MWRGGHRSRGPRQARAPDPGVAWELGRRAVFPNLKPSLRTISVRLPDLLLEELKLLANKRDVPYQSLLKIFLAERVAQELREHRRKLVRA